VNISTHIALSKEVAKALQWKGDLNLLARSAGSPDEVQTIAVEIYGCHVIGKNLASLVHFTKPLGKGKYEGYCWKMDPSVLKINLSSVKVIPHPEAWGFPVTGQWIQEEPFGKLVRDLTQPGHTGCIEADEITYTTSANMAQWAYECYIWCSKNLTGEERQKALDILAGIMLHLGAQDVAVPQHAIGVMLDGHSAFEGDVDEKFKLMVASGEIGKLLETFIKANNAPDGLTLRALAEQTATKAVVSPCKLGWYRSIYRHGWNKFVKQCVIRGLLASVQAVKVLQKAVGEA